MRKAFFWLTILLTLCLTAALADNAVDEEAFANCPALTTVVIPEGVTHIGDRAFEDCKTLESVTLP